jgi:hypothetical protein
LIVLTVLQIIKVALPSFSESDIKSISKALTRSIKKILKSTNGQNTSNKIQVDIHKPGSENITSTILDVIFNSTLHDFFPEYNKTFNNIPEYEA